MQGLVVLVVALLPGALYIWAFERLVGSWGVRFADRALRFVGVSAVLHALALPLTGDFWLDLVGSRVPLRATADISLWVPVLLYVGVPIALGTLIGWGTRNEFRWARIFTGPEPAPRAWDQLFGGGRRGWIRVRLN